MHWIWDNGRTFWLNPSFVRNFLDRCNLLRYCGPDFCKRLKHCVELYSVSSWSLLTHTHNLLSIECVNDRTSWLRKYLGKTDHCQTHCIADKSHFYNLYKTFCLKGLPHLNLHWCKILVKIIPTTFTRLECELNCSNQNKFTKPLFIERDARLDVLYQTIINYILARQVLLWSPPPYDGHCRHSSQMINLRDWRLTSDIIPKEVFTFGALWWLWGRSWRWWR